MHDLSADFLIVGSGLGATAAAVRLAGAGRSVILVPGIGRTRSPHIDGGIVSASLVERAFGPGAPLGARVDRQTLLRPAPGHRWEEDEVASAPSGFIYHRGALETWAMSRAVDAGAVWLDDLVEGKALPNADGTITLTSERDERTIRSGVVVLCEGADPRIPLRVRLRPDYGPEDQIHFARALLAGPSVQVLRYGHWRTGWGMPVEFSLIPQSTGTLVALSARIENVMRSRLSAKDALQDFLSSAAFEALGVPGVRGETGVELIALRRGRAGISFTHDRIVMGIDSSGVIDARRPERADLTIESGLVLAETLLSGGIAAWPEAAYSFVKTSVSAGSAYHDDRGTGYLEEGRTGRESGLGTRLAGIARRMRSFTAERG